MNELTNEIVLSVIATILALTGLAALFLLRKLGDYIETKKRLAKVGSAEALLWTLAQEGYAHAEKTGKEMSASGKFGVAYDYLAKKATELGLEVDADRLRAKTQEAWTKLEGMPRASGLDPTQVRKVVSEEVENMLKE